MNRQVQYDELKRRIHQRFPQVRIKYKSESNFWRCMPKTLREETATALGYTIWLQDRLPRFKGLSHEYKHVEDYDKLGWWFYVLYLMLQLWMLVPLLLAILAIGFNAWTLAGIFLAATVVFLLPLPSQSRPSLELAAYMTSIGIDHWEGKDITPRRERCIDILTGWLYYKMVWSRQEATDMVDKAIKVQLGQLHESSTAYRDIYESTCLGLPTNTKTSETDRVT